MKYVSDVVQTRLLSQNHCYSVGGGTLLKWVVMRCQIKILCLHISYIKKQKIYMYFYRFFLFLWPQGTLNACHQPRQQMFISLITDLRFLWCSRAYLSGSQITKSDSLHKKQNSNPGVFISHSSPRTIQKLSADAGAESVKFSSRVGF